MKEVTEQEIKFYTKNKDVIQPLQHAMVIKKYKLPTHPKQRIIDLQENIKAYHDLKAFCYKSRIGKKYFDNTHRHCMTSKSNDTDWLEILCDELNKVNKNYDKLLSKYEKDMQLYEQTKINNPTLDHIKTSELPINVNLRVNIYANETNTYISKLGQMCIDFEQSILENAQLYINGICPCCGEHITMPKMKKTCPNCNEKIYVRNGGIGQGKIVMTEKQYIQLKKLKDDFYNDREYNPNYGVGIVIKNRKE